MAETRIEVRTIRVDYLCPNCGLDYLRPTGEFFTSLPPQYTHRCNQCQYVEAIRGKTYPYIDYEEVIKPEIFTTS